MLEFIEAQSESDYCAIEGLAKVIWHECFAEIITAAQIDYMLERFLTAGAIEGYTRQGYRFFRVAVAGRFIGFISLRPEEERMFLSKVYLLAEERGKGYGRQLLGFACRCAREAGLGSIYLTVNRNNARAIEVYRRFGYRTVAEQKADIGGGFVMDDFVMELHL